MIKRLVIFTFILMLLVACGTPGPVGPMGPMGPAGADGAVGPQGPPGDGGGSVETRKVDVIIYSGSGPMNLDAVKEVQGLIKGDVFSCEFKVDNGGRIGEGAYMCVPVSDGQPSGQARFFDGTGRISGGPGSHGRTLTSCVSEWQRPPGVGNKWGVRVECSNYNPWTGESLMGGVQRIGKRWPFTASGGDHWRITITIP